MVGEAGEVAEGGDAEERGVEGEGEQGGGGAHRLQIWISRSFYTALALLPDFPGKRSKGAGAPRPRCGPRSSPPLSRACCCVASAGRRGREEACATDESATFFLCFLCSLLFLFFPNPVGRLFVQL